MVISVYSSNKINRAKFDKLRVKAKRGVIRNFTAKRLSSRTRYDFRFVFRRYILIVVDMLLVLAALFLYLKFFHPSALESYHKFSENILWVLCILVLWFFYSYIFNLYKLSNVDRVYLTIRNTVLTAFFTAVTYLFIPFVTPTLPLSRLPVFVLISGMVMLVLLWRLFYGIFFSHPVLHKTAIVVGAGYTGQEIVRTLLHDRRIHHKTGYKIYGYIDDDPEKQGKRYESLKVLGRGSDLLRYARRLHIDELIIAFSEQEKPGPSLYASLIACENLGMLLTQASDLYEEHRGKVMVRMDHGEYFLNNPYSIIRTDNVYQVLNRIINIFCGILAGILFILVLPFLFFGNLAGSRGPVFYSQERVGKNGRKFRILKFRTMIVDAERHTGPQFASPSDTRITPIGKFLRRTRLDELPQFWNILRGDMNLIGPRPEREVFMEELSHVIPFFKLRNAVKPGLTGWAQINHPYASDADDSLIKLQYDLYYIKHRSFFLDLSIVLKTIAVMLKFKGT